MARGAAQGVPGPPTGGCGPAPGAGAAAVARSRQLDTKASIIAFLSEHPGSTAGEVAKGLDLNRASVSNRLSALAKLGEIRKAERGYAAK